MTAGLKESFMRARHRASLGPLFCAGALFLPSFLPPPLSLSLFLFLSFSFIGEKCFIVATRHSPIIINSD